MTPSARRAPRADSRRNSSSVLEAAKEVFAAEGVDAPLEEIAKRAGVGKGTLYRHFATREHLLAAVMAERWARLGELAVEIEAGLPPADTDPATGVASGAVTGVAPDTKAAPDTKVAPDANVVPAADAVSGADVAPGADAVSGADVAPGADAVSGVGVVSGAGAALDAGAAPGVGVASDAVREAIRAWVGAYVASAEGYPGSGAGIAARLAAESEPVTSACSQMRQNFQRLLDRGVQAGVVRDDLDAREVLILVSAVTGAARTSPGARAAERESRFVDVVLAGLAAPSRTGSERGTPIA